MTPALLHSMPSLLAASGCDFGEATRCLTPQLGAHAAYPSLEILSTEPSSTGAIAMSPTAAVSEPTVVDFSAAAASKCPSTGTEAAHPDTRLIKACMDFAVALRGASGAFEIDPTGDNDFAAVLDIALLSRAHKRLNQIVKINPTTLDGLRAKAKLADMAQTYGLNSADDLLSSLCADIVKIHRASKNTSAVMTLS